MREKEKILSICMMGRNDDYGLDFKRRFAQAMNFLAYSSKKAGVYDDIEVVFTDWNSDVPLADVLELTQDAAKMVKFIIVPPEIAKEHNWKDTPFHTTKPFNIAFRRANGKFLANGPADILIPDFTIERLIMLLKGESKSFFDPKRYLMSIPRKWIPCDFKDNIIWEQPDSIEKSVFFFDNYLEMANTFPGSVANSGLIIGSKELFNESSGYDDNLGGYGFQDNAICFDICKSYQTINLSGLGIYCYDFEPSQQFVNTKINRLNIVSVIDINRTNPNWGMPETYFHIAIAKPQSFSKNNHYLNLPKLLNSFIESKTKKKLINIAHSISKYDLSFKEIILAQFSKILQQFNFLDIFPNKIDYSITSKDNPFLNIYSMPEINDNIIDFKSITVLARHLGQLQILSSAILLNDDNSNKNILSQKFDCISLNCDFSLDNAYALFIRCFNFYLNSENGIIIFYSYNENYFIIINKIIAELTGFSLIKCDKLKIGVILKAPYKKEIIDDASTQKLLFNAWSSPFKLKRNIALASLSQFFFVLSKPCEILRKGLNKYRNILKLYSHLKLKSLLFLLKPS